MYYNYDEYMREVLGYPKANDRNPVPQEEPYQASVTYRPEYEARTDLIMCYPDVYKMLTPMIRKACENLYDPITEDDVNKMALEIYFNFEVDEKREEVEENNRSVEPRGTSRSMTRGNNARFDRNLEKSIQAKPSGKEIEKVEENREEEGRIMPPRKPNNSTLLDLIKILILNQILGRPNYPGRPPMPPRPPRPPMHPRDEYTDYGDYPYWSY